MKSIPSPQPYPARGRRGKKALSPAWGRSLGGGAVALAFLFARPVRAEPADQLIGLFMQGCLPFAGDAQGLRKWAGGIGLPALPPEGKAAFLGKQPGMVFDASNQQGKFVLLSGDNGACAATAEEGAPPTMAAEVEAALTGAGIRFTLKSDGDDPRNKMIHHRAYLAHKGDRSWQVVLSTGVHTELSAAP